LTLKKAQTENVHAARKKANAVRTKSKPQRAVIGSLWFPLGSIPASRIIFITPVGFSLAMFERKSSISAVSFLPPGHRIVRRH
jgi:hypothetical protein